MNARLWTLATLLCLSLPALPAGAQVDAIWDPVVGDTFQIQFSGEIDTSVDATVFDIDMFESSPELVAELQANGRKVVCYISAGSWEKWRPDKRDFPDRVLGRGLEGWPGEKWLDIRKLDILRPIMGERMRLCAEKGFDAIEFDNVNGYSNRTGFPLRRRHQVAYDRMLAEVAHDNGLAAGLKNVPELVEQLEPSYDFVINESCFDYDECEPYERFIAADKPVFVLEYELAMSEFCGPATEMGFFALKKRLNLDAWRRVCP
ncbi:MAG: hypothetical protein QOG54_2732 [Actinomycetota bacterium]|jgi:hypothetical protein|nr:hypothetical protein [Actinomycetota bacterium]